MPQLMIGAVAHDRAKIWVKGGMTNLSVTLLLKNTSDGSEKTQELRMNLSTDYTAVHQFTGLKADTVYEYRATFSGGEVRTGSLRTFPSGSSGKFTFIMSSCNLARSDAEKQKSRAVFGRLREIAIAVKARFMIHGGDQIYIDTAEPSEDVRGEQAYWKEYDAVWDNAEAQHFFGLLPNFMILDDHELANNFDNDLPDDIYHHPIASYKDWGLNAYYKYQHCHNPDTPAGKYYYTFDFGDLAFFVMDVRSERRKNSGKIVSPEQMADFTGWLQRNKDKRKIVVSAVPFLSKMSAFRGMSPKDKWFGRVFGGERTYVLARLLEENIGKLLFLSGDVHAAARTDLRLKKGDRTIDLAELICGPLNQRITNGDTAFKLQLAAHPGYRSQVYSGLQVDLNGNEQLKYANVLVITVDGSSVSYKWLPVQEGEAPLKAGSFSF